MVSTVFGVNWASAAANKPFAGTTYCGDRVEHERASLPTAELAGVGGGQEDRHIDVGEIENREDRGDGGDDFAGPRELILHPSIGRRDESQVSTSIALMRSTSASGLLIWEPRLIGWVVAAWREAENRSVEVIIVFALIVGLLADRSRF